MPSSSDSPGQSSDAVSSFLHTIFSYNGNVLLAAIVSLLLVILFVLLLHVYVKWFLSQARHRRRRSVSVSHILGPARFHHFNTLAFDTAFSSSPTKGLEASAIDSIPLFVYESHHHKNGLECVICLSLFEEGEVGRLLPKCGHGFHSECIDVWLRSHSSCPICRGPVVPVGKSNGEEIDLVSNNVILDSINEESALEIVVEVPNSDENEVVVISDSLSACSSSSSLSSQAATLGGSLKRMLSRDRSERKIHPSSNFDESNH
ncbi:RING/U-box superfamily protein [Actinidia rufa]|uniref:RING-type E3 ubiquitin transferase n=1 Tax=Actinidia rufa TaxID=165716 RepID=A0A7J0FUI3_9ERIC|nr:RING/U-box superfamily protein [Actinidia rufa]